MHSGRLKLYANVDLPIHIVQFSQTFYCLLLYHCNNLKCETILLVLTLAKNNEQYK